MGLRGAYFCSALLELRGLVAYIAHTSLVSAVVKLSPKSFNMLVIGIGNTCNVFVLSRYGLLFMYFAALSAVKPYGGKPYLIMLVYEYCFSRR